MAVYPFCETTKFLSTLRLFAKDVGSPKIFVLDPHPAQEKREVKDFCNKIGTTLKVLENETQWADRAEIYIGLMKEAMRKDMQEMHSSLVHVLAHNWHFMQASIDPRNRDMLGSTSVDDAF